MCKVEGGDNAGKVYFSVFVQPVSADGAHIEEGESGGW